ncbi:MAG: DUF2905 domain-containing protein, partial [bacterium]
MGKWEGLLIFIGLAIAGIGAFLCFFPKMPGDILIKSKNFTFYFPIVTCIII